MTSDLHTLDISPVDRWAERAAEVMAAAIAQAIARSGRCLMALSGGSTPLPVFSELANHDLGWERVTIFQVDERIAEAGSPLRNLTAQEEALGHLGANWMPMPVDALLGVTEPHAQARTCAILDGFATELVGLADDPPILDLVHLGLGDDGHTASLFPGDPLVDELGSYVGVTAVHNEARRVSLTRPVLDRARMVIWLVRGSAKVGPLGRLLHGDLSIPAGLIRPAHSVVLADTDAARQC